MDKLEPIFSRRHDYPAEPRQAYEESQVHFEKW